LYHRRRIRSRRFPVFTDGPCARQTTLTSALVTSSRWTCPPSPRVFHFVTVAAVRRSGFYTAAFGRLGGERHLLARRQCSSRFAAPFPSSSRRNIVNDQYSTLRFHDHRLTGPIIIVRSSSTRSKPGTSMVFADITYAGYGLKQRRRVHGLFVHFFVFIRTTLSEWISQ